MQQDNILRLLIKILILFNLIDSFYNEAITLEGVGGRVTVNFKQVLIPRKKARVIKGTGQRRKLLT